LRFWLLILPPSGSRIPRFSGWRGRRRLRGIGLSQRRLPALVSRRRFRRDYVRHFRFGRNLRVLGYGLVRGCRRRFPHDAIQVPDWARALQTLDELKFLDILERRADDSLL